MSAADNMTKLKGVLIGCGAIAREHMAAVAALDFVEIGAVCDISAARAASLADRFGVARWYTDYEQMLREIRPDLVHITTSPASHFPIASSCLAAGLNVFCEKPITIEYREFRELKQMALEHQCLLIENQNFRYHSGIKRIEGLVATGVLGDIVDVQICLSLGILAPRSPYIDPNYPHTALSLRGGIVGDFLPHIAYLAQMFSGPVLDVRTIWLKKTPESLLPHDEFRGFIKGERATAYVSFSGNAQPDGFWVRVAGTRAYVETNLFEPPRLTLRRVRAGEPALVRLLDGIRESKDVLMGTIVGFWRKLAGTSSYDGLPEMIARTYGSLEKSERPPITLDQIDEISNLVDRLTADEVRL